MRDEVIIRTKRFDNKKFWITTSSFAWGKEIGSERWANCLYLHFAKEDFPEIESPKIIECDWFGKKGKRFEYDQSPLANLDWHGGCTFYEETFVIESGRTVVKIGCDYSHYRDENYMSGDHGKMILETDGLKIAEEFEQFYLRIKK